MKQVSSSLTLFFKIFIPTFWMAFFGFFILALLRYGADQMPIFRSIEFKIGALIFYFTGLLSLYYFFMRLKRVEIDDTHIYVTNYFKTYKYPYNDIAEIKESNILFFKKIKIKLLSKGAFGQNFTFIASKKRWSEFVEEKIAMLSHLK